MAKEVGKPEAQHTAAALDPFSAMRTEMDRVFDDFLGTGWGRLPRVFASSDKGPAAPSIDVRENGNEVVIEAELPGMKEEDVDVELRDGILTIKGEKKIEEEKKEDDYHITERRYGSFQRSFRVPDNVDQEKIEASMEKGVLHLKLPKMVEAKTQSRKISVAPK